VRYQSLGKCMRRLSAPRDRRVLLVSAQFPGVGTVYRIALEGSKRNGFLKVLPVRKTGSQHDTLVVGSFVDSNSVRLI
jgi:hypothetical protein